LDDQRVDAATYAAAGATQFADATQAQQWFDGIVYEVATLDADATWDEAAGRLRDIAGSSGLDWAAEALIAYLEHEPDPTAIFRELGDPECTAECISAAVQNGDAAAPAYAGHPDAGDAADGAAPPAAEYSDAAWGDYLGSIQGGWDGGEATWDEFRGRLLQGAPAGLHDAAQALVTHAESSGDKAAALAPYGLVLPSAADAAPPPAETDAAAGDAAGDAAAADEAEIDPAVAALDIQDDTLAELLKEHPEFAALGAEGLEELMTEVLAEFETEEEAS
jgi:hypothetical protein